MKLKILSIIPILALTLCAFTCSHTAATASHGVAASLNALQSAEIALYNAKQVTPSEHLTLEQGFKTLAQEDKAVRQCIATTDVPSCVDGGINAVNSFLASGVNGIKNPDSKQQIQLLGQALVTSLTTLKAAL